MVRIAKEILNKEKWSFYSVLSKRINAIVDGIMVVIGTSTLPYF